MRKAQKATRTVGNNCVPLTSLCIAACRNTHMQIDLILALNHLTHFSKPFHFSLRNVYCVMQHKREY